MAPAAAGDAGRIGAQGHGEARASPPAPSQHRRGRSPPAGSATGTGGDAPSTPLLTGAEKISSAGAAAALAPCRSRRHCTGGSTNGVATLSESAGQIGSKAGIGT